MTTYRSILRKTTLNIKGKKYQELLTVAERIFKVYVCNSQLGLRVMKVILKHFLYHQQNSMTLAD